MRVGFVALTDAAPLIVAAERGMFAARGLEVELVKQASWPAVRDGVLSGELDAAQCLSSLPFSVAAGITGHAGQLLPIAMVLNAGGQGITVGRHIAPDESGGADRAAAVAALSRTRRLTFAMTYPGGTHDLWLRRWLRTAGADPADVEIIPIPPAQMVANLRGGTMDGFSAGEPWNAVADDEGAGITVATGDATVPGFPEKVLVVNRDTLAAHPGRVHALVAATLAACRWLDESDRNRVAAAHMMAARRHVNVAADLIAARMRGRGGPGGPVFHDGGRVNAPRHADGRWILDQFHDLGLTPPVPDPARLVERLTLRDVYAGAAAAEGVPVPDEPAAVARA